MAPYKEAGIIDSGVDKSNSYTQTKTKFNKTWTIDKYDVFMSYESPIFSIGRRSEQLDWRLKLFSQNSYVQPFLVLVASCSLSAITVMHTHSLLNEKGEKVITLTTQSLKQVQKLPLGTEIPFSCAAGNTSFQARDITEAMRHLQLPNGKLTLFCDVEYSVDCALPAADFPVCNLNDDIGLLLESKKFTDFTFAVGRQKFAVHKNILSVRSPVFSAMFEHNMQESQENQVRVTDIKPQVFKEMLHFVYTGQAPNIHKMADKLLMAAEKYELLGLKVMCEETLRTLIAIDNVVDILIIADFHNAERLKTHSINFIASNATEVMQMPDFKEKLQPHSCLITEILEAVVKKNGSA